MIVAGGSSTQKEVTMVIILSYIACLHTMCMLHTIQTPASFTEEECAHQGYWISLKHSPKNWRVVGHLCEKGLIA